VYQTLDLGELALKRRGRRPTVFHFISIDAVVSAESDACAAPLTTTEPPAATATEALK
jgi:hypothetical protein